MEFFLRLFLSPINKEMKKRPLLTASFRYYTFFTNSDFNFIAPKLGILQSML